MMRLRPSLKNSARAARNSLIAILSLTLSAGCSLSSTPPSYSSRNLSLALENILAQEYQIAAVVRLVKQTIWIYIPLKENLSVESDKIQESVKKFEIKSLEGNLEDEILSFSYDINDVPETRERQKGIDFNPAVLDKMHKVIRALYRIIFSLERSQGAPRFFVIITADIKHGLEYTTINYIDDFKKASFEMISWVEYQHRTISEGKRSPEAIGDTKGWHIKFYNISLQEFITKQIEQRIRSKFGQPEVNKGVDIDKEVLKTARQVIEIYNFKEFLLLDLANLVTGNKTSLSRSRVIENIKE